MTNATRYIAYTSIGHWAFTRPKRSPQEATHAAENQISSALFESLGLPNNPGSLRFGEWLRSEHPDIVVMSHDYIGEVRAVELLDGEPPRQFRKRFCNVSYHEEATQTNALGEAFA